MKFSNFIVLLNILLSFLFFSCKQDKPSETTGGEEAGPLVGSLIDSLGTNEAVIYSVPSPVQATTLLKLLDIDYSDELINDTKIHPPTYTTSYQRALNLGVSIVDMTYVHLYEQYQPCIIYLARIKKLMEELGLDSPNEIKVLERIESNIQSNDSLQNIVEEFHRNYDKNFAVRENEKSALLVLSGFYIEGLYLISEIYIDNLSVKRLSRMMKNSFDNMILQQQVLLANMIELLNQYDDIDTRKLISQLSLIQKEFSDMQITYTQDEITKKIKNIKYNTDEISSLNDVVKKIRQTII